MADGFASWLDTACRRRGLTMTGVAAKTRISPSVLSRLRTGQRPPTAAHVAALARCFACDPAERTQLEELAALARAPAALRTRLARAADQTAAAHAGREAAERDLAAWRADTAFHDGWWLGCSRSFLNDGRVQRYLLSVRGGQASVQVMDAGTVRYSYHGAFEVLGDKIFVRASEDRGGAEWLQLTLHSQFDFTQPTLLYGLVCGISGRDLAHPVSLPCAARTVLLYAGGHDLPPAALKSLQASLGLWSEAALRPVWPESLGQARHLRAALDAVDGDLDAAVLRLIGNRLGPQDWVLRAALS